MNGRLEVIAGPMFSGKSEELLRRLRRAEVAGNKVVLIKPAIDSRNGSTHVVSHAGSKMPALTASSASELRTATFGYHVVGVDEVQFFEEAAGILLKMAQRQIVIVSGLDMTYRLDPFGEMPYLLAVADRVDKYTAVCHSCGAEATRTQRLLDGQPAPFDGPTVQVGGLESYEARCRKCFRAA